MKKLFYFIACAAMVIVFSACGGQGNGNGSGSSSGLKEPFAFLQATESAGWALGTEEVSFSPSESKKMFKKEETAKQTEILDKMMAGSNKKIAQVYSKMFYKGGVYVDVTVGGLSIDNGAKLDTRSTGNISLVVSLKEFPEVEYPFERYFIILDKKGNVARIVADRSSYSWNLERVKVKGMINYHNPWGSKGVSDKIVEERRIFWQNGGTSETDRYHKIAFE